MFAALQLRVPAGLGELPPWTLARLDDRTDLVITGIGKANAAGAVARVMDPARHAGVVSFGICGSLGEAGVGLGEVVAATGCIFADDGILTPAGFSDCAAMGFPLGDFAGPAVPVHSDWLAELVAAGAKPGPIATVSTCSGTDALAHEVHQRTGAIAEAMEGAAVALVAHRLAMPAAEVRAVSNTTGDRAHQRWDLHAALDALTALLGRVRAGANR